MFGPQLDDFIDEFMKVMENECAGISAYLEHRVSGENPYQESIERNMSTIEQRIASL